MAKGPMNGNRGATAGLPRLKSIDKSTVKRLLSYIKKYKILLVIAIISIIFSSRLQIALMLKPDMTKINKNGLSVHFVDVGQGDATLIRFPNNKTMIIDSIIS